MTKIRHGKHILTPAQAENRLAGYSDRIKGLTNVQTFVQAWVDAQLDNHKPYFNGPLDVSGAEDSAELYEKFVEKLTRDLWCTSCGNPWPCRRLGELRVLRDSLFQGNGDDLTPAYDALKNFHKPKHINTIPVHV